VRLSCLLPDAAAAADVSNGETKHKQPHALVCILHTEAAVSGISRKATAMWW
jgi:hypothetical protein